MLFGPYETSGWCSCHRAARLNVALCLAFTTCWQHPLQKRRDSARHHCKLSSNHKRRKNQPEGESDTMLRLLSSRWLLLFSGRGLGTVVLLFSNTSMITLAFSRSQSLALNISGLISTDPFWFDMATRSSSLYSQKYLLVTLQHPS